MFKLSFYGCGPIGYMVPGLDALILGSLVRTPPCCQVLGCSGGRDSGRLGVGVRLAKPVLTNLGLALDPIWMSGKFSADHY